jgi:peroxiredoxin
MNKNSKLIFSLIIFAMIKSGLIFAETLKIGVAAPEFALNAADGKKVSLSDFKGKWVVLEWFNPGCPFVQKHYKPGHMQQLQSTFTEQGVIWLNINSTNPNHPDYRSPEKALEQAKSLGIHSTALLPDPTGTAGKSYGAKTTPHMFIIDPKGILAYEGAIDDSPNPNTDPSKATNFIKQALNEALAGKPISNPQTKQYGCSVKYAD